MFGKWQGGRGAEQVIAKEALILPGRDLGATSTVLSGISGLTAAIVSRRHDIAVQKIENDPNLKKTHDRIRAAYKKSIDRES